jgi:kinetochore protein Nuf2
MKPMLKAPGNKCLKLKYDEPPSNFALKFSLRRYIMECCGVPDFGFRDLMKPEYARTRRNISAVINFAKFREEKVGLCRLTAG